MWKNHPLFLFIVSIGLILGGCQMAKENGKDLKPSEMSEKDLPDVRALQDEFTRDFIQSINEVETGYYPFLSGTKRYRLLFPMEGLIHQGYAVKDDQSEGFLMSVINDNGADSQIKVNYHADWSKESVKGALKIFEGRLEQKLDFEKITSESSEVYYAPFEFEPDIFGIASLVLSPNGEGAVQVVYDMQCLDAPEKCQLIKEAEVDKMIHWVRSIEFVDK